MALRPGGEAERLQVIPRRWVIERPFAWLSRSRRLTRDDERLPETGVAMIHAAMRAKGPRTAWASARVASLKTRRPLPTPTPSPCRRSRR
ncbi:MAG: transposase [Geminicoccaceae bacterium]